MVPALEPEVPAEKTMISSCLSSNVIQVKSHLKVASAMRDCLSRKSQKRGRARL